MTSPIIYPAPPITPHGQYYLTKGTHPEVVLKAWDGSIEFNLMGGRSIPNYYTAPECVQIRRDGLKGLIPPWRHIDQKGATEDGVTQIDALLEPNEIQAELVCRGRDPQHTREVTRRLIDSIDAIRQSELGFLTTEMGYWWSPIRWYKGAPPMPLAGGQTLRQPVSLRLRGDRGLWQTYAITATVTGGGGFVPLANIGDQPMYFDVVCFGPGTFGISDGPGGGLVSLGPLASNQIALVRTDPRKRGVYDLTTATPPQQSLNNFQTLLKKFLSFAAGNNLPPLLQAIESAFGIAPPQGPLYALLKGRFSDEAAIPPKSPGRAAVAQNIFISISGGGAGTQAIVSAVPLRRYPL